ncbi:MAG: alanine:cation symporter family protein [Bacteroidia bacterium]|nr:alanine:cation symporter family protein [Bacteroidia bacterium]
MSKLDQYTTIFSDYAWGMPLLILLIGGGLFFLIYSRFAPFLYLGHAVNVLRGKYDDPDSPGDINHFQALSTALAATVGMGNIAGVAVAITTGGPGAIFWMWISATVGMATKFFTCTLAIMFRGKDSLGHIQGGPMYVIREGLGKKWQPLAVFFSLAGLIGCLPLFQANQLRESVFQVFLAPAGIEDSTNLRLIIGTGMALVVGLVIFGGIKRIGNVAAKMVPAMVLLYVGSVLTIILLNADKIGETFGLIFSDAFTGSAVLGGALGELIRTGVKRAAFSNEAGIGTAPMAHGAAKTEVPIREGLIAMMGPFIDTIVVCTMTALALIITGAWSSGNTQGISVTLQAFEIGLPGVGSYLLMLCGAIFALTTLFSYSYYGGKCLGYLVGAQNQHWYNYFYVASIVFGSVVSITSVINIIDGMFALMAIPTMLSTIMLSPKVASAAKIYFQELKLENKMMR